MILILIHVWLFQFPNGTAKTVETWQAQTCVYTLSWDRWSCECWSLSIIQCNPSFKTTPENHTKMVVKEGWSSVKSSFAQKYEDKEGQNTKTRVLKVWNWVVCRHSETNKQNLKIKNMQKIQQNKTEYKFLRDSSSSKPRTIPKQTNNWCHLGDSRRLCARDWCTSVKAVMWGRWCIN